MCVQLTWETETAEQVVLVLLDADADPFVLARVVSAQIRRSIWDKNRRFRYIEEEEEKKGVVLSYPQNSLRLDDSQQEHWKEACE